MPNTYRITIQNNTGAPQNYSFFSATPIVSGSSSGEIWSNVLKAANNTPNGAKAFLDVWTNYYAICGSYDGKPEQGARVSVSKSVPINLGSKSGGITMMGSSVALNVIDKETCDLGPPTNPGNGKIGNFQLVTASDQFTYQDAVNNNILIGIANSKDGDIFTAMGTFTPFPSSSYQIQPQMVYHVATGQRFDAGQLVKVEQLGSTIAVDFNQRGTNNVVIVHNEQMLFEFA
ncbi:hypothetical protein BJX66DRAFT_339091 [Aspergillus keveii]|uniref:Uncharacterized protein n=1 Tax=Aspergillus keveii TaxID=714993 RepID=A0ABR4G3H5_9EURO